MATKNWLDTIEDIHKVRIIEQTGDTEIQAPLPDDFGLTVGSEFSTPFDIQGFGETVNKVLAFQGISRKTGFQMKKLYTNPELSEISFDLSFVSYYSAIHEVVMPIVQLMRMAVGKATEAENIEALIVQVTKHLGNASRKILDNPEAQDAIEQVKNAERSVRENIGGSNNSDEQSINQQQQQNTREAILELISVIQGPNKVTLKFGKVLSLEDCYISSASPQFSNVLDPWGVPQSANISLTAVLENAPLDSDVIRWFGGDQNLNISG